MATIRRRKRQPFPNAVAKGAAKGLGKLATHTAGRVVSEIASILTLGLFRPRRRK